MMSKSRKRVFEVDRRMELRLRLAAKNAGLKEKEAFVPLYASGVHEQEVVYRIIERVKKL
jgi:hypothetical protein